jgi:uncharacterized glyoxalase superfamily protein PhnB
MTPVTTAAIRFDKAVPQFTVPDLVHTCEYYRDVFGFRIEGYWDGEGVTLHPETPPYFAIVSRDNIQIFFSRADDAEFRTHGAEGGYNAYFRIVGVDALATEWQKRGAEILDGPATRVYGERELVVKDCNGLILCCGEFVSEKDTRGHC